MGVAIYARKSTESEDRQVQSLEDQLNVLRKLAANSGILVTEEIIEARSAKEPGTRPEFDRMVSKIKSGEITGLLVWQMNRLSRNMVDGGIIAHLLQTEKLQFIHTADKTYRPSDSALLLAIENGASTDFIQNLSRNVKRGMEGKAMRGWQNGRAPFGYVNNPLTREIEPDPKRFHLLQRGWEMLESGGNTIADVRRELMKLGLTTVAGKAELPTSLIYSTYRRRFYCGDLVFRGQYFPGKHQAMVSRETFNKVQELLGNSLKPRDPEMKHPYAGLMRCGICGCQITAETKVKRDKQGNARQSYTYYHCTGAKGCRKSSSNGTVLDRMVDRLYDTFRLNPVVAKFAIPVISRQMIESSSIDDSRLEELSQTVTRVERRLKRITEMRMDDELSSKEFKQEKTRLEHEMVNARTEMTKAEHETQAEAADIERRLMLLAETRSLVNLSTAMKRGFIRAIAESCFLTQEHLELRVHPIIQKVATFELPLNSSESDETGVSLRMFPSWYGETDVILYNLREKPENLAESSKAD